MKKKVLLLIALLLPLIACAQVSILDVSILEEDVDGWKCKTSKGFIVQYSKKDSKGRDGVWIIYPDSIKFRIDVRSNTSYDYFKSKYNSTKEIPYPDLLAGYISSDISKLPDNEIAKIIREKVIELFGKDIENTRSENGSYFYWSTVCLDEDKHDCHPGIYIYSLETEEILGLYIGKHLSSDNDRYVTEKKRKADIEAKEKSVKAAQENFKKKYGFYPNLSIGQVIKAGRKLSAINAWKEYRDLCYPFSLRTDNGASKCYRITECGWSNLGHMWVKNGVVTSVTWY